ncbi:MAG: ATP-binding protein [Candidatus Rokuibacteriota bacterium]
MSQLRGLLVWSAVEEAKALHELFRDDRGLVLGTLGRHGEIPLDLPPCDRVVIVADWTRLAAEPSATDAWRRSLAPSPLAIVVRVAHDELDEALPRLDPNQIDEILDVPCPPEHLVRRIQTAFRYLAAQQGTRGLRAELTEQAADFREFQRVALALSAEGDVNRLLELIVTKCREVTTADAGSLYLVEEAASESGRPASDTERMLRFVVAQNDSKPLDLKSVTLPLNRASIAGYVALTRTPLNLADVYRLPPDVEFAFNSSLDRAFGYRTVSMLVIPMVDHTDEIIGVIQVINKKRAPEIRLHTPESTAWEAQPFGARDQDMVNSLANLAAVVAVKGREAEQVRRQLESQLRQAQKMEAVGRLAGGVAHDFNNLLTVVLGRSQLLLNGMAPDDPGRKNLELIQETAERAAALTQQLLAFSRKQMLQPRVLDLNDVLAGLDAMLRRLIGEDIDLEILAGTRLGRTKADRGQLEQVIMNLVVNARDAMPHGGQLTIETANVALDDAFVSRHAGARAGRYVMLSVRDTGIGMDIEVQGHLFEPFFTTKEPGKGTGLGLATVYGIVKQHQGDITVESKPGRGATFTVYLPRIEEPADAVEPAVAPGRPAHGSETVLVVEDEEAVRTLVREILQMNGYLVVEAGHGAEALQASERHEGPIHLLLTDVVMPEMSGRTLADRVMATRPTMKVLYISGHTDDAIVHHGVLDPGTVMLLKPFTPEALVRKVRAVLDG